MQEFDRTRFYSDVSKKYVEWTNVLCEKCNINQEKKVRFILYNFSDIIIFVFTVFFKVG